MITPSQGYEAIEIDPDMNTLYKDYQEQYAICNFMFGWYFGHLSPIIHSRD